MAAIQDEENLCAGPLSVALRGENDLLGVRQKRTRKRLM